jgi:hypothetical protein
MIDFEVIFTEWFTDRTIRSKVYAVTKDEFLIADSEKFMWVPIESCELPITKAVVSETSTTPYWDDPTQDDYDRWTKESQKDY